MEAFATKTLPDQYDDIAPDGSEVRILARIDRGSAAHFQLDAGYVAQAVMHRTIDEIWYFLSGNGKFWRRSENGKEETVDVGPGVCITIPARTQFQFKATGNEPLKAFGVTMPPWPGSGEGEVQLVKGKDTWTTKLPPR